MNNKEETKIKNEQSSDDEIDSKVYRYDYNIPKYNKYIRT